MYTNIVLVATQADLAPLLPGHTLANIHTYDEIVSCDAVIVDVTLPAPGGIALVHEIKHHYTTAHVPVIALVPDSTPALVQEVLVAGADDWVCTPSLQNTLADRLALCIARAARDVATNPLTLLPGNRSINAQIQKRAEVGIAILYCDIDNFKSYNDRYGFYAGDEVLQAMAAMLAQQLESQDEEGFVGHIGGDDFVVITQPGHAETIAEGICRAFDAAAGSFYNKADRDRGKITSLGRDGTIQEFPLMALTIAVVTNGGKDATPSQLGQLATRIKRRAKIKEPDGAKSTYVLYQEVQIRL